VDAAVTKSLLKGIAAAIFRDHTGLYLGASALVLPGITDPTVLESIACREALALADHLGISNTYIASDCKQVIDA
jgi:hypothetical protein